MLNWGASSNSLLVRAVDLAETILLKDPWFPEETPKWIGKNASANLKATMKILCVLDPTIIKNALACPLGRTHVISTNITEGDNFGRTWGFNPGPPKLVLPIFHSLLAYHLPELVTLTQRCRCHKIRCKPPDDVLEALRSGLKIFKNRVEMEKREKKGREKEEKNARKGMSCCHLPHLP